MSIPDSKESALTEESRATNLHAAIMNLQCATFKSYSESYDDAYSRGHCDARHAAAELALRSDAINAELLEALTACTEAMEIQEGREQERFHLSSAAFVPMWTDAINKARAVIAKATGL